MCLCWSVCIKLARRSCWALGMGECGHGIPTLLGYRELRIEWDSFLNSCSIELFCLPTPLLVNLKQINTKIAVSVESKTILVCTYSR